MVASSRATEQLSNRVTQEPRRLNGGSENSSKRHCQEDGKVREGRHLPVAVAWRRCDRSEPGSRAGGHSGAHHRKEADHAYPQRDHARRQARAGEGEEGSRPSAASDRQACSSSQGRNAKGRSSCRASAAASDHPRVRSGRRGGGTRRERSACSARNAEGCGTGAGDRRRRAETFCWTGASERRDRSAIARSPGCASKLCRAAVRGAIDADDRAWPSGSARSDGGASGRWCAQRGADGNSSRRCRHAR